MRKLKLQMHITVDGFVAGPNGEHDWAFISGPDAAGFQRIIDNAETSDTVLMGRKLAQGFTDYWANMAVNPADTPQKTFGQLITNMRKVVFTASGATATGNKLEVEHDDLVSVVQALKNEPGKDIIVYGGVDFARSLVKHNLIDEYIMILNPVAIGAGQTIFEEQKVLKLVSSETFNNGKVLNKYVPA